jgi:hypothetical protein
MKINDATNQGHTVLHGESQVKMDKTKISRFQKTFCAIIPHTHPRKPKGFTLIELLVFLWILIFALTGAFRGMLFASQYGHRWAVLGAIIGFFAGIIGAITLAVLFTLICQMIAKFSVWWRPFPPVCENGSCHVKDYSSTETPLSVRKYVEGILYHAYRCKCGNLYTTIGSMSLKTQWVRILTDNTVQPYLKHYLFGRWKPDTSNRIEIPTGCDEISWEIELFSMRTLKPIQEAFLILILIPTIMPIVFISMRAFLPLLLGKGDILPTGEFLLLSYAIPLIMGTAISIAYCANKNTTARSIEANEDCIRIKLYNKRQVEIQWDRIISIKYRKNMDGQFWIFRLPEKKMTISNDGFKHKEWQLFSDYIRQHIPGHCQLKES